jgi:hypothetical protein
MNNIELHEKATLLYDTVTKYQLAKMVVELKNGVEKQGKQYLDASKRVDICDWYVHVHLGTVAMPVEIIKSPNGQSNVIFVNYKDEHFVMSEYDFSTEYELMDVG